MPRCAEINWTDRDLSQEQFSTPAFPKGRQIRRVSIPAGAQVHQPASGIGSTNAVELTVSDASASAWSVFENVLDNRTPPLVVYEWTVDQTFDAWFPTPSEGFVRLWVSPFPADSLKRLSQALHQTLQQEPVLDGFGHPGELILQRMFDDHAAESSKWVKTRLSESDESSHKADILKLLCRFKPQTADWRRGIVTIALQSPSIEVRDVAIQAIESWAESELIDVLRSHSERVSWLADYARQVLRDLEGPQ